MATVEVLPSVATPTTATEATVTKGNIKVTVESWSPVAIYAPEVTDLECHICRTNLTEVCITCIQLKNIETQRCPISQGDCNHAFHQHCIRRWLTNGEGVCPVDKTTWHCRVEDIDANQIKQQMVRAKTSTATTATGSSSSKTSAGHSSSSSSGVTGSVGIKPAASKNTH